VSDSDSDSDWALAGVLLALVLAMHWRPGTRRLRPVAMRNLNLTDRLGVRASESRVAPGRRRIL
jgi:hypothetical protein